MATAARGWSDARPRLPRRGYNFHYYIEILAPPGNEGLPRRTSVTKHGTAPDGRATSITDTNLI